MRGPLEAAEPADTGAEGAPRFRFACQRSGRCCTHGEGHVWIDERELSALAAELEIGPVEFARRFVREVVDPGSGRPRLSLREQAGRCVLLEGTNECAAYAARPAQCRSFPRWKAILSEARTFERTRAICPGIAVVVEAGLLARAARRLVDWYARRAPVAAGAACPFPDRGDSVHATGLEVDVALAQGAQAPGDGWRATAGERAMSAGCPFWSAKPPDGVAGGVAGGAADGAADGAAGSCRAGALRPLACRPAFRSARDTEGAELLWRELRAIERELDYPGATGRIGALVESRLAEEVEP